MTNESELLNQRYQARVDQAFLVPGTPSPAITREDVNHPEPGERRHTTILRLAKDLTGYANTAREHQSMVTMSPDVVASWAAMLEVAAADFCDDAGHCPRCV